MIMNTDAHKSENISTPSSSLNKAVLRLNPDNLMETVCSLKGKNNMSCQKKNDINVKKGIVKWYCYTTLKILLNDICCLDYILLTFVNLCVSKS